MVIDIIQGSGFKGSGFRVHYLNQVNTPINKILLSRPYKTKSRLFFKRRLPLKSVIYQNKLLLPSSNRKAEKTEQAGTEENEGTGFGD
jgi:hypothetical protein